MWVGECHVCVCGRRSRPRCAPPLAGSCGRPGLRAPCGQAERMGLGFGRLSGRAGGEGLAGWRTGWWSVVLTCTCTCTCSLARSAGRSGPEGLRGSDGPGLACLAQLGSACDCVCLECVCVGRSPLKDRLQKSAGLRNLRYLHLRAAVISARRVAGARICSSGGGRTLAASTRVFIATAL